MTWKDVIGLKPIGSLLIVTTYPAAPWTDKQKTPQEKARGGGGKTPLTMRTIFLKSRGRCLT